MHCITQLARSLSLKNKKCTESNRESLVDFLDNLPSPYRLSDKDVLCAGDSAREDCQPEYIIEEICKILINIYLKCSENNLAQSSQGLFYAFSHIQQGKQRKPIKIKTLHFLFSVDTVEPTTIMLTRSQLTQNQKIYLILITYVFVKQKIRDI